MASGVLSGLWGTASRSSEEDAQRIKEMMPSAARKIDWSDDESATAHALVNMLDNVCMFEKVKAAEQGSRAWRLCTRIHAKLSRRRWSAADCDKQRVSFAERAEPRY